MKRMVHPGGAMVQRGDRPLLYEVDRPFDMTSGLVPVTPVRQKTED